MIKSILVTAISLTSISQFAFAQNTMSMVSPTSMKIEAKATATHIDTLKKQLMLADATKKMTVDGLDETVITNIINEAVAKLKEDDQKLEFAKLILRSAKTRSDEAYAKNFLAHFQTLKLLKKEIYLTAKASKNAFIQDMPVPITQTIFNNTLHDMTDAKVVIKTSDNFEVNKAQFDAGDIAFLSSKKTDSELQVKVLRTATCGEKATIDMTYSGLINGKTISGTRNYDLRIGQGLTVTREANGALKDGKIHFKTLTDADKGAEVYGLKFDGVLLMKNPGDKDTTMNLSLVSSSGKKLELYKDVLIKTKENKSLRLRGIKTSLMNGQDFSGDWHLLLEEKTKLVTVTPLNLGLNTTGKFVCPSAPTITYKGSLSVNERKSLFIEPEVSNDYFSSSFSNTYKWERLDKESIDLETSGENSSRLRVYTSNIDKDVKVQYRFTVTTEYGYTASKDFEIKILDKKTPKLTALPSSMEVNSFTFLELTADATNPADGKLTYEWKLDGKVIGRSKDLFYLIPYTELGDVQRLDLTVSNKIGSTTSTTILSIKGKGFGPNTSTPPRRNNASSSDGGGALFYMIAGLLGLLQIRRRS
ncbi:hypothetical protein [Algicola sagamiensis]|uniref:hypothetical protein n=1 Tax=Algicola sagamiensis TaxID=163869 RepID=UPI0003654409|nr:hypothetical protein [Algicola sagamiensis]